MEHVRVKLVLVSIARRIGDSSAFALQAATVVKDTSDRELSVVDHLSRANAGLPYEGCLVNAFCHESFADHHQLNWRRLNAQLCLRGTNESATRFPGENPRLYLRVGYHD